MSQPPDDGKHNTSGVYKERRTSNKRIAFDDDEDHNNNTDSNNTAINNIMAKAPPEESQHWQSLDHQEGDKWIHTLDELKDRFRSDVLRYNGNDGNGGNSDANHTTNNDNGGELMAVWSCLSGYCEALATHKDASKRYQIFPVPIDALERLVRTEFWSRVLEPAAKTAAAASSSSSPNASNGNNPLSLKDHQEAHRSLVRAVANAVWDTAVNSQKKDEEHANSVYVCLRGNLDRKSIDCLGSSVATVAGVKMLQQQQQQRQQQEGNGREGTDAVVVSSMLALSEDHAYEMHSISKTRENSDSVAESSAARGTTATGPNEAETLRGTCEVAIPGSTKRQKAKRACEIAETFRDKKASVLLTPESSWLYMAQKPVVCSTVPVSLVPIVANINCNIGSKTPGVSSSLESRQLYRLKRELLWVLYDVGAMEAFPFGILELGDCEAVAGSERGEEWLVSQSPLVEHGEPILRNEELFLEAIGISRRRYNDAQIYPYYYAGHYHKDAGGGSSNEEEEEESEGTGKDGSKSSESNNTHNNNNSSGTGTTGCNLPVVCNNNENDDNEHRFADALRMYSEAARVTSRYRFDTGDNLQLNKHLTSVTGMIYEEILTVVEEEPPNNNKRLPRAWIRASNARACCFWLLRFLDHLLHWEEWSSVASSNAGLTSKNPRFVEVLQVSHKTFVGKLFQTFGPEIRTAAVEDFFRVVRDEPPAAAASTEARRPTTPARENPSFPVSKRLGKQTTLLAKSLRATKVQICDLDLEILDDDDDGGGGRRGRRSSKRRKRS